MISTPIKLLISLTVFGLVLADMNNLKDVKHFTVLNYFPDVSYIEGYVYIPDINFTDYFPDVNFTNYFTNNYESNNIQDIFLEKSIQAGYYIYKYRIEVLLFLILLANITYNRPLQRESRISYDIDIQSQITSLLSDNKPRKAKNIIIDLNLDFNKNFLNTKYLYPMAKKGIIKKDKDMYTWTLKN